MPESVILEHYEVLKREDGSLHELGRGAMGITYKGIDTHLKVPVTLKVINAAHLHSDSARQRFVREARSAARLRHRNVASVFHLGEQDGNYYYAMEFIDGETVDALVKRQGALPLPVALRITAQVARALNAAQLQELVHRDIKPSNLMVLQEDDDLVVKVIDFGLAKTTFAAGEGDEKSLTHGGFLGTPHFASPELLEEREIDTRSDIYALGVTLWFLLLGKTPFGGSVARVMGQHLTKQPPFEELSAYPAPVVDLLRRMLAKDPADRPQTPIALRKDIEQCLKSLPGAAPRRPTAGGSRPSAAGDVTMVPDDIQLKTGAVIAQRYQIIEDLGENEAGESFRADDLKEDRDVRLLVLHRELISDSESAAQIEREAGRLMAYSHPHALEVLDFIRAESFAFLALGWAAGFNLRDLLRVRRELSPNEVVSLLAPAAAAVDGALAAQIERLELGLHHVLIHFPAKDVAPESLLPRPLAEWPDFVVKINPLATWRDLFAQGWAAGQTLVGGAGYREHQSSLGKAGALRALGALAHELLGGVPLGSSAHDFSPLAALSEAGNAVLARALRAPETFASGEELIRQLAAPPATSIAATPQQSGPPPQATNIPGSDSAVGPPPTPPTELPTHLPPPEPRSAPKSPSSSLQIGASVFGLLLLIGITIFLLRLPQPQIPGTVLPPPPTPGPRLALTTPLATKPRPTIRPGTPSSLPSTPPPAPSRRELATAARARAEALEARQANREALGAWLKMADDFPEFDTGRVGLELLLNRLRHQPSGMSAKEFDSLRKPIEAAAKLGVLSAMMILGEELQTRESTRAFAWFCAAAEAGESLAMTQAGLMLSSGDGTSKDLKKAFLYMNAAAEKNEPNAVTFLADMYLRGLGVKKDEVHAARLLEKASALGSARAKNWLGEMYHKGIGVPPNGEKAFRLFSEASERGYWEATTNLGVLHMKGVGTPPNPGKAVERFKEASSHGNVNGMYYYAGCLLGVPGVNANEAEAKKWFQKAAVAGHRDAIEWCKENGVPVKAAR